MRTRFSTKIDNHGFTLVELALIILAIALLIPLLVLGIKSSKHEAIVKNCQKNLKLVGLAYRTWSLGSSDAFIQQCETKYGGSKEWLMAGQISLHFGRMSNELESVKVLACPADQEKFAAQSFAEGFTNANVSYFASLDAQDTYPQTFLSGDRNLALRGKNVGQGIQILTTNLSRALSWTRTIHNKCGNIGLGDGSVQRLDQHSLVEAFLNQGMITNRLVFP